MESMRIMTIIWQIGNLSESHTSTNHPIHPVICGCPLCRFWLFLAINVPSKPWTHPRQHGPARTGEPRASPCGHGYIANRGSLRKGSG
jgi:hypothetical protein